MRAPATNIDPHLIDELLERYCDWRTECIGVRAAYEHFLDAPGSDRELAFAAYGAALDREGSAADAYAAQVHRVVALDPDVSRRLRDEED